MHDETNTDGVTAPEETPRQVSIAEIFPSKQTPLDALEKGSCARAAKVLAHLREAAGDNPNFGAPVDIENLDDDVTRAVSHLWAAGLVRLFVGVDPATGRKIGMTRPFGIAPTQWN